MNTTQFISDNNQSVRTITFLMIFLCGVFFVLGLLALLEARHLDNEDESISRTSDGRRGEEEVALIE